MKHLVATFKNITPKYEYYYTICKLHLLSILKGLAYVVDGIILMVTLGFVFIGFSSVMHHLETQEYFKILQHRMKKNKGDKR